MVETSNEPESEDLAGFSEELAELEGDTSQFLKKRLILWVIRWVIGFAIIGVVVYFYENLTWLWWAGGGLAAVSLLLTLIVGRIMSKSMAEAENTLDQLHEMMKEPDQP